MDQFEKNLQETRDSFEVNQQELAVEVVTLFNTALTLWKNKDATKYIDREIKLQKEWYDEFSKTPHSRLALDGISRELRILRAAFIRQANSPDAND